ncbi:NAD(P)-dependent dehydrogenase (short-subunit alcohol dehydrogenase family) [Paraburkholderia sp. GAS199]|uniref:SDR family oxidoreductase n=1 Tax=Paraburkholderia sp. GAS199 TaxID=3035126 RepID=UPI003D21F6D0
MNATFDFSGKSILVTGASSGIGWATVEALRASGANVVAAARNVAELARLAEETGCEPLVLDVSDEAAIDEALASLDAFDGLVNCAGIALLERAVDTTAASFDRVMAVNTRGAVLVAKHVARAMIATNRAGSIVNVSSQAGLVALDDHLSYSASKAAMDAVTRALCLELGPSGIRVNSVNPTVTLTPMAVMAWSDPVKRDPALQGIPLRRFAEPMEVAAPILFLLSDAASMISGVCLPIDGGYTAR